MSARAQQVISLLPAAEWVRTFEQRFEHSVKRHVLLGAHTSFGVGGPATLMARASSAHECSQLLHMARQADVDVLLLGDGQQTLVGDWGFDGLVVHLDGEFCRLMPEAGALSIGAACSVGRVLQACLAARLDASALTPLDGHIGAALLRADASQRQALEALFEHIEFVTREGVHHSIGLLSELPEDTWMITRVVLRAKPALGDADVCDRMEARRLLMQTRRPRHPNLGSIFYLEDGRSADAAIREVGLAGVVVGQACIPKRHCGTVVNLGGATARDTLELIDCVAARLAGRLALKLDLHLRIVGGF
jgi:UDP-N-acetylmuramate dehydrogenase